MSPHHLISLPVELLRGIFEQTLNIKDVTKLVIATTGSVHHPDILLVLQGCALSEIRLVDNLFLHRCLQSCLQWKLGAQKLRLDKCDLNADLNSLLNSCNRVHSVHCKMHGKINTQTDVNAMDNIICSTVRCFSSAGSFQPLLPKMLAKFPFLEEFKLYGQSGAVLLPCKFTRCMDYQLYGCSPLAPTLENHLRNMPNLLTVRLFYCDMDISDVHILCKYCKGLQKIDLAWNELIDDDCMRLICDTFSGTLRSLGFCHTKVSPSGIEYVCWSCPTLQKLSIDGLVLSSECLRLICHKLHLHTLDIRLCKGYNDSDLEFLRAHNFPDLRIGTSYK